MSCQRGDKSVDFCVVPALCLQHPPPSCLPSLDKILAAMTIAAERNNKERFASIVEGLENHEAQQLQVWTHCRDTTPTFLSSRSSHMQSNWLVPHPAQQSLINRDSPLEIILLISFTFILKKTAHRILCGWSRLLFRTTHKRVCAYPDCSNTTTVFCTETCAFLCKLLQNCSHVATAGQQPCWRDTILHHRSHKGLWWCL